MKRQEKNNKPIKMKIKWANILKIRNAHREDIESNWKL